VPRGAEVLPNPNGTAPGLLIRHDGHLIVLLPGPPREVNPMIDALCAGTLLESIGRERLYRARLFVAGRSESSVEEAAQPLYSKWKEETPPIVTTILASPGQVELHLTIRDPDGEHAHVRLLRAQADLHRAVGEDVFSTDGRLLEEVVGEQLVARGYRIAAAESCTGGLLMARLTDVPGSSRYVHAALVPEQPAFVRTFNFVGGRSMVRTQAAQAAMDRVRRLLQPAAR